MYREFEKYLIKPSEGREELNKYLDKIFLFLNNSISLKDEDYHRYFFDNEYFLNNPIREEYRSSFYYYFLKEFRKDQNFHKLLQSSWKEVSRNSIKHIQDKLNEIPEEQLKSVGLLGVQLKLKTNTFNKFIKIFGRFLHKADLKRILSLMNSTLSSLSKVLPIPVDPISELKEIIEAVISQRKKKKKKE